MNLRSLQLTKWISLVCLAAILAPATLMAQEDSASFVANADTYLRSTSPDNTANFGDKTTMYVRNSISSYHQLGLVRFDASSFDLPSTVQLDSAKVFMTVGAGLNTAINVRLISVSDSYDLWQENDITWNSYKAGDLDTLGTIATTYVAAKHMRYSWDVTDHLRQELVSGNKIISLAIFQDYNTGANTTFITKDSVTADENKPFLALFTHKVPVKVVNLSASLDRNTSSILLDWQTAAEQNTAYAVVERSTNNKDYAAISGHLTVQGSKADSTSYTYTDDNPVSGYTNYYRIKYVMTDNTTYTSDGVAAAFFVVVNALEDAYVQLGNSSANHGSETKLLVKNDGNSTYSRISFLKFDLNGLRGTAQAAKLHLTINSANTSIAAVTWYLWDIADNNWTENAITGKNYPSMSDSSRILSSRSGISTGAVDFNIPVNIIRDVLNADGILSLAITSNNISSTDDVSFVSKDSANADAIPVLLISEDPADNVTPVNLSKLTAQLQGDGILLTWKAFTELNVDHFEMQRSQDGVHFNSINTVDARGTATTTKSYAFTDALPIIGINYYRLKAVDKNGDVNYSNITSAIWSKITVARTWKVYPNPVHAGGKIHITLKQRSESDINVCILDVTGRIIKVQKFSKGAALQINTEGLTSGIYFIQLLTERGQAIDKARKILVQ